MSCLWGKDNHVFVDVDLQTGLGSGGRYDFTKNDFDKVTEYF